MRGRKSTPGRYFQVANPGTGWGGTDIQEPLSIVEKIAPDTAWPGLRLLMVSTTGEHHAYFVLDDKLVPQPAPMPEAIALVVERIAENCEPALCTVLFMAGAGGSLRAGVTDNPIRLTRSVRDMLTRVTLGGAPAYVWPGGGITVMVDVATMPDNAFGYRADPRPRRADRVHHAPRRLSRHGWAHEPRAADRDGAEFAAHQVDPVDRRPRLAAAADGSGGVMAIAGGPAARRQAAAPAARADRPRHRGLGSWPTKYVRPIGRPSRAFDGVLEALVAELTTLRTPLGTERPTMAGPVAERMVDACWPHRAPSSRRWPRSPAPSPIISSRR